MTDCLGWQSVAIPAKDLTVPGTLGEDNLLAHMLPSRYLWLSRRAGCVVKAIVTPLAVGDRRSRNGRLIQGHNGVTCAFGARSPFLDRAQAETGCPASVARSACYFLAIQRLMFVGHIAWKQQQTSVHCSK